MSITYNDKRDSKSKDKQRRNSIRLGEDERTVEELEMFKKKMIEDDRMDSIFRAGQNLTEKFDNRAYLHPHGMSEFDYKSIPEYRRNDFEKFKHKCRHENYQYLSEHAEVDALIALFLKKLLQVNPQDSIRFAAEFFTRDTTENNFEELLNQEKERLSHYRVAKMKAAGKITTIALHETSKAGQVKPLKLCRNKKGEEDEPPIPEISTIKMQEEVLNWLKKLNIGPLALDVEEAKPEPLIVIKPASKKKKPKKYCGCKDPGRKEKAHPNSKPFKTTPIDLSKKGNLIKPVLKQ